MNYKQLLDTSNVIWAAIIRAVETIGIDLNLLLTNELSYVLANDLEGLMKDAGLYIATEESVDAVIDNYIKVMKENGFCQISEIVDKNNESISIKLGHCVFSTGCENIRAKTKDNTTPCPMIAILLGNLEKIDKPLSTLLLLLQ